jgi:hypothetical protein
MKKLLITITALACAGCLHTHEVDKGDNGERADNGQKEDGKAQGKGEAAPKAPAKKATASNDAKPEATRPAAEEGRPELSVSPEGLMKPEGPLLIQQALARKGYLPREHETGSLDDETSAALRKFQGDEQVAKTGAPDRETVRRLGIALDKVFRSSKS